MPNLTAADMASRTMKKGWAKKSEAEEAEDARESAANATGRSGGVARLAIAREKIRHKEEEAAAPRRKSPLYEPKED